MKWSKVLNWVVCMLSQVNECDKIYHLILSNIYFTSLLRVVNRVVNGFENGL